MAESLRVPRLICWVALLGTVVLQLLIGYWHVEAVQYLRGIGQTQLPLINLPLFLPLAPAVLTVWLLKSGRDSAALVTAVVSLLLASLWAFGWYALRHGGI